MRLLLDTHIILWALTADPRLSATTQDLLLDPHNDVFFSAATILEIAIKHSLRRESMPIAAEHAMRLFAEAGYEELSITAAHAAKVETLPPLHNDPFDRLLVAQALTEPMRLVTHDRLIGSYSDSILLV
jgi:PIN domain nuclease of toxin-antitoxin system